LLANPEYNGAFKPKRVEKSRPVWTGSTFEDVSIYAAAQLEPGDLIEGPAIVESEFTTILVTQSRDARIDGARNIILETKQG